MTNPGVTSLTAYWTMNHKADSSPYERYCEISFNNTLDGVNLPGWVRSERYIAADLLAASTQCLRADDNSLLDLSGTSFTMGVWIKPRDVATASRLINKWTDGSDATKREYVLFIDTDAKLYFAVCDGATNYIVAASTFGVLTDDEVYFVCAYFDDATNIIGIGVNNIWNTASGPTGPAGVNNYTNKLYFGSHAETDYYFEGFIDEAFIYKRLLTVAERTWMYNSGYPRSYEDLASIGPPIITVDTSLSAGDVDIYVIDTNYDGPYIFRVINLIEDYYNLIWTERYSEVGEFELELPIEYASDPSLAFGNLLYIKNSDKIMIIEGKKQSTEEDKTSLLVTGQSLEAVLQRRILTNPLTLDGRAEINIYKLLVEHLLVPDDVDRELDMFATNDWPYYVSFPEMLNVATVQEQFGSQTAYSVIKAIATIANLGYKLVVQDLVDDPAEEYKKLKFFVYAGLDRSTDQSDRSSVIFSDTFGNVLTSSFYSSEKGKVNIVLVITEDEIAALQRIFVWADGDSYNGGGTEPTDIGRFEGLLDNNTINRDTDGDEVDDLTDAEVVDIICTRGREAIKENSPDGIFDGDFDFRTPFQYGVDFFIGDIIQCVIHGMDVKARVLEVVRSYSADGEKIHVALDYLV
jgi:hypothetical protein